MIFLFFPKLMIHIFIIFQHVFPHGIFRLYSVKYFENFENLFENLFSLRRSGSLRSISSQHTYVN